MALWTNHAQVKCVGESGRLILLLLVLLVAVSGQPAWGQSAHEAKLIPVVVALGGIALGARAKNTNAAKLFIDFVLSKEGQTVVRGSQRNPRNPARKDVQAPLAKMEMARIKSKRVPDEVETNLEHYAKSYREIVRIK